VLSVFQQALSNQVEQIGGRIDFFSFEVFDEYPTHSVELFIEGLCVTGEQIPKLPANQLPDEQG